MKFQLLFVCLLVSSNLSIHAQTSSLDPITHFPFSNNWRDSCKLNTDIIQLFPKIKGHTDTSISWFASTQKVALQGKIFKLDRITPADNVEIYYWQKNSFTTTLVSGKERPSSLQNGYILSSVRTNGKGEFTIYIGRPFYSKVDESAIPIHIAIKEPTLSYAYCVDDIYFNDDEHLSKQQLTSQHHRGGTGIVKVLLPGKIQIVLHEIIEGLHIPEYVENRNEKLLSGLPIGEFNPSFNPFHAWGPDAGNRTCMACSYGRYHGIIYEVHQQPNWEEIKQWLRFLEKESVTRGRYLKVFFVYANELGYVDSVRQKELEDIGRELHITKTALTYVPSIHDTESEMHANQFHPQTMNNFIITLDGVIIDKFMNLRPNEASFHILSKVLEDTKREDFELVHPRL